MHPSRKKKNEGCAICKKKFSYKEVAPFAMVSHGLSELIKSKHPDWDEEKFICHNDLSNFRSQFIKESIFKDQREISEVEQSVIVSFCSSADYYDESESTGGKGQITGRNGL